MGGHILLLCFCIAVLPNEKIATIVIDLYNKLNKCVMSEENDTVKRKIIYIDAPRKLKIIGVR